MKVCSDDVMFPEHLVRALSRSVWVSSGVNQNFLAFCNLCIPTQKAACSQLNWFKYISHQHNHAKSQKSLGENSLQSTLLNHTMHLNAITTYCLSSPTNLYPQTTSTTNYSQISPTT